MPVHYFGSIAAAFTNCQLKDQIQKRINHSSASKKKSNLWATLLIANILQKVTLMHCIFEPVTAPQSEALIYTVTKLIASYRIKLDDFRSQ